jgi:hypothetical protein
LPTVKRILLENEEENTVVRVYVGVKPRIDMDAEFLFLSNKVGPVQLNNLEAKNI